MKTSELVKPIIDKILRKLDAHDEDLGEQCWMDPKEEPLEYFVQNADRKMFVVKKVFNRTGVERKDVLEDCAEDSIGYTLLFLWRLKNKGG